MKIIRLIILTLICISSIYAQGTIVTKTVNSPSLETNLLNDSHERLVNIYLPSTYTFFTEKHYPVVYLLNGFNGNHNLWIGGSYLNMNIKTILDELISQDLIQPMIVVMPDGSNKYGGSWYTNSKVTGNWEDFITIDLIEYIDQNYRTLKQPESRGISGHSMGGYGALKIAMKNPDIFGSIYCMSAAWTDFEDVVLGKFDSYLKKAISATTLNGLEWQTKAVIAGAAAFAPNENHLPFYGDFPIKADGEIIDSIWARWLDHDPPRMVLNNLENLSKIKHIALECGKYDANIYNPNIKLSQLLNQEGIQNTFDDYDGNHTNKIPQRIEENMLPFFSECLVDSIAVNAELDIEWVKTSNSIDAEINCLAFNKNGDIFAGARGAGVFRSIDKGDTWLEVNNGLPSMANVWCLDINSNGDIFAGEYDVFLSQDNGNTWNATNNGFPGHGVMCLAVNMNNGYIYYGSWVDGVVRSTDNGDSWLKTSLEGNITSLTINHNGDIFAANKDFQIHRSLDNGDSWTKINDSLGSSNIAINSAGYIYVGDDWGGGLFYSNDNGDTWIEANNGLTDLDIRSILVNSEGAIFVGTDSSGIFYSNNNGDSWSQINNGLDNLSIKFLSINSDDQIFAVTEDNNIYRNFSTPTFVTREKSKPYFYRLTQNYPNPFNPNTTIRYSIPQQSNVTLKVFDVLGSEVATLVNKEQPQGNYEVVFYGSDLTSGIYLYRIQAGDFIETKKMILLK